MKSAVEEFASSQGVEIILTRDEHPATWLMVKYFFHSFGVGTDILVLRGIFLGQTRSRGSVWTCVVYLYENCLLKTVFYKDSNF